MNTRECCAACLHTDRSLPHLSRFFSAQVCSATAKTIPCPPPPGCGEVVYKGGEKKKENLYTVVGTHARKRAPLFSFLDFHPVGHRQRQWCG